jgi:hypothetical protein
MRKPDESFEFPKMRLAERGKNLDVVNRRSENERLH